MLLRIKISFDLSKNYIFFPLIFLELRDTIITESRERSPMGNELFGLDDIDLKKKTGDLILMAKNNEKKAALENFKMQAANEVGVNLKQGYNGDLTSKQAGSVGGQMVKKMVESYENSLKTNG